MKIAVDLAAAAAASAVVVVIVAARWMRWSGNHVSNEMSLVL